MAEVVFGNVVDTDGIVFDIYYDCRDKELFIKATLLLPIRCERQYPESREYEILEYLKHFGNRRIIEAVWDKQRKGKKVPTRIEAVERENINNVYCPRISQTLGENVVILACEISESPNRVGLAIAQNQSLENTQLYFSKEPGFGGRIIELRFEHAISEEDVLMLRAIALTPTLSSQSTRLSHRNIKKALWASVRANWKEYFHLFKEVPDMMKQTEPAFETVEVCEYPFHIAGEPTNELIILEWHCEIVRRYVDEDD